MRYWKTFLRNHAAEVWACDFLQVPDLFFRPLFAFFIIELKSRKVIRLNLSFLQKGSNTRLCGALADTICSCWNAATDIALRDIFIGNDGGFDVGSINHDGRIED